MQELASQLPSRIIASVFVGARLAMSLAPPALLHNPKLFAVRGLHTHVPRFPG